MKKAPIARGPAQISEMPPPGPDAALREEAAVGTRSAANAARYPYRTEPLGQLDLHVYTRGEIELHQGIDRLRGWLHDIEQPLVRPHLELLA